MPGEREWEHESSHPEVGEGTRGYLLILVNANLSDFLL